MHVFAQQQKVQNKHHHKKSKRDAAKMKKSSSSPSHLQAMCVSDDEGEDEGTAGGLASLSIQLLDLMHTLHTRAATIFTSWAEEEQSSEERESIDACHSALWIKCWCPLLQGEDLDIIITCTCTQIFVGIICLYSASDIQSVHGYCECIELYKSVLCLCHYCY